MGVKERESDAYRRLRKPRNTPAEMARRDEAIWRGWVSGKNERVLAFEFDVSVRVISRVLAAHKKLVAEAEPTVDEFRQMILEGTRDVIATMVDHMHKPPSPAYSNGKPITLTKDDGTVETVWDYSLSLNAADRVLRAYERLGKITGVEAPDPLNVTVEVQAKTDAQLAAEAALARLMQAANPPALPAESVRVSSEVVGETAKYDADEIVRMHYDYAKRDDDNG